VATEAITRHALPPDELEPARRHASRVHRLRLNALAWALGSVAITTLWVVSQWTANGTFESFGHEGETGQWNPTLWAIAVGGWGLVVGIMALGVYFTGHPVRFHVSAWVLGMAVLTPLWALIEWQDNGAFERWSSSSRPGDWDPWILTVGAIWAASIVLLLALRHHRSAGAA
jgi:predicted anti-sigma-YlaC factor YlaD